MSKYFLDKIIQILSENPDYIDELLKDPHKFARKFSVPIREDEIMYLESIDKTTLTQYIRYGFDNRISKVLWTWYYKQFLGSSVIHAIPNVCYGGISVHQFMLSDMIRNLCFKKAIEVAINENNNCIVADVGTGTGILALYSSMAGALKVYAVEIDDKILKIASELIEENKQQDKVILLKADAQTVILPEKVDLIVSECIGSFGINTTFLPKVLTFKKNNLKDGGIIIPKMITLYIAPYNTVFYDLWVNFSQKDLLGISLKPIDKYLKNQVFAIIGDQKGLLSEPKELWTLNLHDYLYKDIQFNKKLVFNIEKKGILHGFLGWFTAHLFDKIVLETSPESPRTHWYQVFFPIKKPLLVKKGDTITVTFNALVTPMSIRWKWFVKYKEYEFYHDTRYSYPINNFNNIPKR